MFAFAEGNTFAATLGTTFGGIIGSLSIAFLPWVGIQGAYIGAAPSLAVGAVDLYKALSMVFFVALIPVFIVFLSALKTAVPLAGGAFLICIAIILDGVYYLQFPSQEVIKTTSGALYIIVGIILLYLATAIMNQEENIPVVCISYTKLFQQEQYADICSFIFFSLSLLFLATMTNSRVLSFDTIQTFMTFPASIHTYSCSNF